MKKLDIEKIFRRNYRPYGVYDYNSLVDWIVLLKQLRDGLKKGKYLWSNHAYGLLSKHESLEQLNFMHKKLMSLNDNSKVLSSLSLDILESEEVKKYDQLVWENILLNDNITCEVGKINRDYYFWDEIEKKIHVTL